VLIPRVGEDDSTVGHLVGSTEFLLYSGPIVGDPSVHAVGTSVVREMKGKAYPQISALLGPFIEIKLGVGGLRRTN
jgi:hypothetical protein